MIKNTRLRYVCSKSEDKILQYVNVLIEYRIEIKQIVHAKNKWYLWFILPDDATLKESKFGNID